MAILHAGIVEAFSDRLPHSPAAKARHSCAATQAETGYKRRRDCVSTIIEPCSHIRCLGENASHQPELCVGDISIS